MYARVAAITAALMGGTALTVPHVSAAPAETVPHVPAAPAAAPGPMIISHRGASGYAPENTLASIDKAADLGFSWVENDVQRTKDGELVVIHDATLARTTDAEQRYPGRVPWRVADFTAAEISRLDAGSWFGSRYAGARVPTLEQYMRRVTRNHQKLVLEIKNPELYPGIEKQTLKVLSNEGWLDRAHVEHKLIVQSFSADAVRTVHTLRPGVTTAFLGTPKTSELPAYARFADRINPSYATLSTRYVAAVHAIDGPHGRPLKVLTWTVNDAATARRVHGYGVDGVITNKPDVVRGAVRGH
ncbi:glycerophosphodiester phosphodiesterase [Streptomyces sp. NPDC008313]|uniref:glycerophosphodiester phosphodiesterase n=1 Tax=Streptomyces sp. NPDC008313 TaxID=3364826 RepID=UPI0036EE43C5